MVFLLLSLACQPEDSTVVQGKADTANDFTDTADSGTTDSGTTDSGTTDSGTTDSGTTDTTETTPWMDDDNTVYPIEGIDVSHWNGSIDWAKVAGDGIVFMIAKATESDYYTDSKFQGEFDGAGDEGIIRGAYHFAIPDDSDGATQAKWFVENGGDWVADGTILPGTLDIEYNPYGATCYGLSKTEMAAWIEDFNNEYIALTGRAPMVYSNADWWNTCVGDSDLPAVNDLWVAYWSAGPPKLPSDFSSYTFWQYSDSGTVSGISTDTDMDWFPGTLHELRDYALDR